MIVAAGGWIPGGLFIPSGEAAWTLHGWSQDSVNDLCSSELHLLSMDLTLEHLCTPLDQEWPCDYKTSSFCSEPHKSCQITSSSSLAPKAEQPHSYGTVPATQPTVQLQGICIAYQQCQNITWELSSFNNRTGGNRTTTASGWFFLPQGKRWQVGIMGMGRRTFCSWHSNNHLWSASPLQRDRPTYIRHVLLQLLSLKGSWKLAEHHTASSCSKHNSDLCEESDTEINTKAIYWDI